MPRASFVAFLLRLSVHDGTYFKLHAAQIQLTRDPYSTCAGFKHGFQVNILGDRPLLHVLCVQLKSSKLYPTSHLGIDVEALACFAVCQAAMLPSYHGFSSKCLWTLDLK